MPGQRLGDGLAATYTNIVGEELADRTPAGLWPSDHAGVVATVVPEPSSRLLALIALLTFAAHRGVKAVADGVSRRLALLARRHDRHYGRGPTAAG